MDEDGGGTLDWEEFRTAMLDNLPGREAKLLTVFETLDVTLSGSLNFDEFCNAWRALNLPFEIKEVHQIFDMLDTNGSGELDWDEFRSGMQERIDKQSINMQKLKMLMDNVGIAEQEHLDFGGASNINR